MHDIYIYTGKDTVYDKDKNKLVSLSSVSASSIYLPSIFKLSNCNISNKVININEFIGNNFTLIYDMKKGFEIYYGDIKTSQVTEYKIPFRGFELKNGLIDVHTGTRLFFAFLDNISNSVAYDTIRLEQRFGSFYDLRVGLINRLYTVKVISDIGNKKVVISNFNDMYILFYGTFCFVINKDDFTLVLVGAAKKIEGYCVEIDIDNILYIFNAELSQLLKLEFTKRTFFYNRR